jgi:hypothetical protein
MSANQPDISTASIYTILPIFLGASAIVAWMGAFIVTSDAVTGDGYSANSWPSIRGQVAKVISSTMVGMFILLVTSIIYFIQDQTKSIYVIFILVALASVLSYSAMAAASIS